MSMIIRPYLKGKERGKSVRNHYCHSTTTNTNNNNNNNNHHLDLIFTGV